MGGADFIDAAVEVAPVERREAQLRGHVLATSSAICLRSRRSTPSCWSPGRRHDKISVQSIDQPTYVLGGGADDVLNVNVQIGAGRTAARAVRRTGST